MLHRVIEVQALACLRKTIVGQTPDPHGPVPDDQGASCLAQSAPQRFGVELFAQAINACPRDDKTALTDDRTPAGRLPTVIESKTGARVNPMPAFRFLP